MLWNKFLIFSVLYAIIVVRKLAQRVTEWDVKKERYKMIGLSQHPIDNLLISLGGVQMAYTSSVSIKFHTESVDAIVIRRRNELGKAKLVYDDTRVC